MSLLLPFLFKLFSVLLSFVLVILTYIKWSHQYWSRRNIPFFPPSVPFGNLQNPAKKTVSIGVHVKNMYDAARKNGWKRCGLYFFASPVYLIADLDHLKNVMTKDFEHFTDRGMYYNEKSDPISAHLFAVGGTKWKNLRSRLAPTFTPAKMKMMFPVLVECVRRLLDAVEETATDVDVKALLERFTADVIGSCAFGLECGAFEEDDSPFRVYSRKVFASTKTRSFRMTFASSFPTLGRLLGIRQVSKDVSEFFTTIVKDTIAYREKNNVSRPDFLQLLIDLRRQGRAFSLTLEEVVAQSFIFFVAGFESSTTTMTFALYELAKNEDVQRKSREEICRILKKHGGVISYESVNDMKYLDQVINESLRKYPPFPFVTRTCVQDYETQDLVIQKGQRVIIPILGIHLDQEYYSEPEKFDPERFSDENVNSRHPYAHIPFGEGPRNCIGMRFGLMQSKVGLVALLRDYKFTVNSRMRDPLKMALNSFVLTAEGGIWLDVHKLSIAM